MLNNNAPGAGITNPPEEEEGEKEGWEGDSLPTLAELRERARALDEEVRRHLAVLQRLGRRA